MPDQYIINGSIDIAGNPDRKNLRVQAFDRDLPSLERRLGGGPPLLGKALTDAEGRFQITYGLEQFSASEGATAADVSFRVFDPSGRELAIRVIRALDREYRGDQVIFNVPNPFNVVLSVQAVPQGGSEYEQLVAAVSPIIAPLQLTEITDEDVAFIASELGYAQQDERGQHLEWLRRSTLLAADSGVPAEAFYGWGRKGLPAGLAELIAQPLSELPTILAKLSAIASDKLRDALLAAIADNIISASLRDRAGAIASALHRRAQQSFTLRLRLQMASTADPLSGYAVTTLDVDRNNADLGTDVTDSLGELTVTYFDDAEAGRAVRNLRFRARAPDSNDAIEVTQRVQPTDDVIAIAIPIASADRTFQKLRETAQLQLPDDLVQTLQSSYGISSLADIRRRGGLHRIAAVRKLDSPVVQRLDALADLDRLCKDVPEATALIDRKYDSVFAIADVTRATFVAAISTDGSPITRERATELHIAAKAQTDLLDQMFAGIALDIAAGLRPQTGVAPDEYSPLPQEENHG
jgi:hypothetical protein